MRDLQASRTAVRVARRRAEHQVLDTPLVFEDPLAVRISGATIADLQAADAGDSRLVRFSRVLRAFLAVRSRIAEDEVAAAVARGVRQYVVLGAGYDTFACRNSYPGLRVFEVDQPATQGAKRERLIECGIGLPASATFVPVNFATESLADRLERSGFDPAGGAVFSWLGVTPYLERDAVLHTIAAVGRLAGAGGALVFDYGLPPDGLDAARRAAFDMLVKRLDAIGEPWRTFFDPAELAGELAARGFPSVTDLSGDAINARYFTGRTDGLRVGSIGRVVIATTAPYGVRAN
jgi:methyltransferase (TIGR00027 family)